MLPQVRHLPARIIPEPTKMIERTVRVIWLPRGGPEKHLVVKFGRRRLVRRIAKAGRHIAEEIILHGNHLPNFPSAQRVASALKIRTGAILHAYLHDAF